MLPYVVIAALFAVEVSHIFYAVLMFLLIISDSVFIFWVILIFAEGDASLKLSFFYDDWVKIDPLGFKNSPWDTMEFLKLIGEG